MDRNSLQKLRAVVAAGPPYGKELLAELRSDSRSGARRLYRTCLRRLVGEVAERERIEAMFVFEREARANGFVRVAGVDEVGRGPLAGPIVAGAVVLAEPVAGLDDSKKLTAEQRDSLFVTLEAGAHAIGLAVVESEAIDRMGIQAANYGAMAQAVARIEPPPDFLLVDGYNLPGVSQPRMRLVKGDSRSLSIAAASIMAKVTRDRIMAMLDRDYPEYGFARNKGYGTREHLDALARFGPCPAHRRSFAPIAKPAETGKLFDDT